jgi:hypothetical protein
LFKYCGLFCSLQKNFFLYKLSEINKLQKKKDEIQAVQEQSVSSGLFLQFFHLFFWFLLTLAAQFTHTKVGSFQVLGKVQALLLNFCWLQSFFILASILSKN